MKLFVDSANLDDIEQALRRGFPRGVTTNPTIMARERVQDFDDHLHRLIGLLRDHGADIPLSVEVMTTHPAEMLTQADRLIEEFGYYPNINIKVPIGWEELSVIAELHRRGVAVNCTCCMTFAQALMAAQAGANYVSLFWNRIRDIGGDAAGVVRQVVDAFRRRGCTTEVIVGSIRHMADITDAIAAGADIVTVPPQFFPQLCSHPKTDEAVAQFMKDCRQWQPTELLSWEGQSSDLARRP